MDKTFCFSFCRLPCGRWKCEHNSDPVKQTFSGKLIAKAGGRQRTGAGKIINRSSLWCFFPNQLVTSAKVQTGEATLTYSMMMAAHLRWRVGLQSTPERLTPRSLRTPSASWVWRQRERFWTNPEARNTTTAVSKWNRAHAAPTARVRRWKSNQSNWWLLWTTRCNITVYKYSTGFTILLN